jgi:DNA methylase
MTKFQSLAVSDAMLNEFLEGACSHEPINGLTHTFYRYPARFSPTFARSAIKTFTEPGDIVMDPFMGGGTTIVESTALGRRCVGLDISGLSVFLAKVKAIPIAEVDLVAVEQWGSRTAKTQLNLRRPRKCAEEWIQQGYHRNIEGRQTWAIRKILELAIDSVERLRTVAQKRFARAAILRTAQWALDCRSDVPSVERFREQLLEYLHEMTVGARTYRAVVGEANASCSFSGSRMLLLHRSAEGVEHCASVRKFGVPRLILTSPPYPGVHVVYHRWQVLGRKETPAPFWIANSVDGNGLSYYTFGDRHNPGLSTYFKTARATFESIARLADEQTLFVQMVAFSEPSWQLPTYLETLEAIGLSEIRLPQLATASDGRLWRTVPNRKWYAATRERQGAAREVVLLHRRY